MANIFFEHHQALVFGLRARGRKEGGIVRGAGAPE